MSQEFELHELWPYRSATLTGKTIPIPRVCKQAQSLENLIPRNKQDNHIVACYISDEAGLVVWFSDSTAYLATYDQLRIVNPDRKISIE